MTVAVKGGVAQVTVRGGVVVVLVLAVLVVVVVVAWGWQRGQSQLPDGGGAGSRG